ncbi:leukocyte immunoglobulin-like receptor subfamily A member 5 [Nannospalax galili]|uniref:leukocyte immunoglobulin-like receptor subfamily A member 5 n=1 Tax=Nannospalax galili TaxID=1026970 RepID=UPI00081A0ECC|nr:leukocyte immunoglobulin-like receptor subfamily A member 5 [Nannospalax galili]
MTPIVTALLYIGLSSSPFTPVQKQTLPPPILWAEPGSVVSWGKAVTILCQGILEAQQYYLDKVGSMPHVYTQTLMEPGAKAKFPIQVTTELHAAQYRCYYESPAGSSEDSETLELVVTGIYSKPRLSALPSSVVTPGENVTLQCASWLGFGSFILTKEGDSNLSWTQGSQRHSNGHMQALFSVGPVMPSQKWRFRCYGCDKSNAQVCSASSDPLELMISDSLPQDHTVENLIRITMAGLVLVTLGILLFEAQHSQRKIQDAARR